MTVRVTVIGTPGRSSIVLQSFFAFLTQRISFGLNYSGYFYHMFCFFSSPEKSSHACSDTLEETESLLRDVVEEGLLSDARFVAETRRHLSLIRLQVEDYRLESHCATTFTKQLKGVLSGLSRKIAMWTGPQEASSAERKRLLAQRGGLPVEVRETLTTACSRCDRHIDADATVHSVIRMSRPEAGSLYHAACPSTRIAVPGERSNSYASNCADRIFQKCGVTPSQSAPIVDKSYASTAPSNVTHSPCTSHTDTGKRRSRPHHRLHIPYAVQSLLRRAGRDLAVRGQRHPALARLVRSKHLMTLVSVSSEKQPKGIRKKSFVHKAELVACALAIDDPDSEEWQDEDNDSESILMGMPILLSDSPSMPALGRDRGG
ncbi:hypothetical protein B0H21DRAFT_882013 [Amylocystis lapponica]|nr:hypothetical protein B0H21DRAFT_882013 [Amylocystis lapponica]